jgi:hypothetical protein
MEQPRSCGLGKSARSTESLHAGTRSDDLDVKAGVDITRRIFAAQVFARRDRELARMQGELTDAD